MSKLLISEDSEGNFFANFERYEDYIVFASDKYVVNKDHEKHICKRGIGFCDPCKTKIIGVIDACNTLSHRIGDPSLSRSEVMFLEYLLIKNIFMYSQEYNRFFLIIFDDIKKLYSYDLECIKDSMENICAAFKSYIEHGAPDLFLIDKCEA